MFVFLGSPGFAAVGKHEGDFQTPHGRGDEFHHGGSPDPRGQPPKGFSQRDIYIQTSTSTRSR